MTTFNGGSLGSCIDEERSELRYVMWIAEFSESSNLWTHIALQGPLCSMSVWVSDPFLRLTTRLLIGLVEVLKEKRKEKKFPLILGFFSEFFFYPFKYIDWITLCLCFFSGRAEVVNGSCLVQKFSYFLSWVSNSPKVRMPLYLLYVSNTNEKEVYSSNLWCGIKGKKIFFFHQRGDQNSFHWQEKHTKPRDGKENKYETYLMTSNQSRLPAELKHINKRRKRN